MSVPDTAPVRKPSRLGLFLPFAALGILIVAWSILWFWARSEAGSRMDHAVADLQRAGYRVAWKDRQIGGYPFRMDVTLIAPDLREPSGWGLQAPRLEAEASAFAPGRWIAAWPQGVTFVRPEAGPVAVSGKLIRASLGDLGRRPPSFDFEGVDLAFQPLPGAQPFSLTAAKRVEFHLRAGPDDLGGVFFSVEGGKGRPAGFFAKVAGDKPVSIVWNANLTRMSAFTGGDWPDAVRHWADAGGQMTLRQAGVTAGDTVVGATGGTLTAGPDGRVRGRVQATLRQAPRALTALGEVGALPYETAKAAQAIVLARQGTGETAQADLVFQAGRTTLGPVAIGPAPKVYETR